MILSKVANFFGSNIEELERNPMLKWTTFCNKVQQLQTFFSHSNVQQKLSHPNLNLHFIPLRWFNLKSHSNLNIHLVQLLLVNF